MQQLPREWLVARSRDPERRITGNETSGQAGDLQSTSRAGRPMPIAARIIGLPSRLNNSGHAGYVTISICLDVLPGGPQTKLDGARVDLPELAVRHGAQNVRF